MFEFSIYSFFVFGKLLFILPSIAGFDISVLGKSVFLSTHYCRCHNPLPVWDVHAGELQSGGDMDAIYASRDGNLTFQLQNLIGCD